MRHQQVKRRLRAFFVHAGGGTREGERLWAAWCIVGLERNGLGLAVVCVCVFVCVQGQAQV